MAATTQRDPSDGVGGDAPASRSGAIKVASGILVSRVAGLVRDAVLAFSFGAGPHADVFRTALRGPNLLQNLLGEQTLSASFIPIYSRLLAEGRERDAGRFAGAIFGLLLAAAGGLTLIGVLLAEPIVGIVASGYLRDAAAVAAGEASVDRFPLAVRAVRILFPMTGVLVLSAWALGVLNSHRRFFLPYLAPAVWNAAIIGALLWVGGDALRSSQLSGSGLDRLLLAACWGALGGGLLQFLVQVPTVAGVLTGFRLSWSLNTVGVRKALSSFAPLAAGRGAVQLSSYLDLWLSSFLLAGAQAALGWAQALYLLPVSLFGLSVAAAELPELSRAGGQGGLRVTAALRQSAFLTVPTVVGYLLFGRVLVGGLYERGSFGSADAWLVTATLAAYSVGLLASNMSRTLTNVFYVAGKTAVPARIAVERVLLSAGIGGFLMLEFDRMRVEEVFPSAGESSLMMGAVGLACGSAVASWYELARLRRRLDLVEAPIRLPVAAVGRMFLVAAIASLPAWAVARSAADWPGIAAAFAVLAVFALGYLGVARMLGWDELKAWLHRGDRT